MLLLAGDVRPTLPALAGIPLVVVLFKVAGLYDRDQLRIVHSTLDELPLIGQLAGLYALSVTILQPILLDGRLDGLADRPAVGRRLRRDRRRAHAALARSPRAGSRSSAASSSASRGAPSGSARSC